VLDRRFRPHDPGRAIVIKEAVELVAEHRPGGLALEQDVVPALQRDESRARHRCRDLPSLIERDPRVISAVKDQRRGVHLRQALCHVEIPDLDLELHGVLRRGRQPLQFVEPVDLLQRSVGHELGREELAIGGIVAAPAALDQREDRPVLFLRAALRPTPRKRLAPCRATKGDPPALTGDSGG
jgi:hypothetical protein